MYICRCQIRIIYVYMLYTHLEIPLKIQLQGPPPCHRLPCHPVHRSNQRVPRASQGDRLGEYSPCVVVYMVMYACNMYEFINVYMQICIYKYIYII